MHFRNPSMSFAIFEMNVISNFLIFLMFINSILIKKTFGANRNTVSGLCALKCECSEIPEIIPTFVCQQSSLTDVALISIRSNIFPRCFFNLVFITFFLWSILNLKLKIYHGSDSFIRIF